MKGKRMLKLRHKKMSGDKNAAAVREKYKAKLEQIAKQRSKINDDIRKIDSNSMGMQQVSQAGLLAHYALLAVIIGNMVGTARKHFLEKHVESLGNKELDIGKKLEQLGDFEKNSKEMVVLGKTIESLPKEEQGEFLQKMEGLVAIRDGIAQKLGLNDLEFESLNKTFMEHHEKITSSQEKETKVNPFEGVKIETKGLEITN